ncbi:hypothetical protein [Altererythrobacter sp.]|uniref:hypothetical protein n=1 Tax=Altererythrobacter sp. TaxID=1872480 RepID=UPI003D0048B0
MLRKLLALGGLGYAGYRLFLGARARRHAAFAAGQPQGSHTDVRDAGPAAMRDAPVREWTRIDEAGDESFPASDPPGGY